MLKVDRLAVIALALAVVACGLLGPTPPAASTAITAPSSPAPATPSSGATPLPFPPEPVAWMGVKLMTNGLGKADRNEGKRGPFLKVMDAVGMGFDS